MARIPYNAIILTGGRGSRLGNIRKDQIAVAGQTLGDSARSATNDATHRVIVGPPPKEEGYDIGEYLWEEPHYGGPAAAIAAGWKHLSKNNIDPASPVLILAVDLARLPELVSALLVSWRTAPPGTKLVLPRDTKLKDQNAAVAISSDELTLFVERHQPTVDNPNPLVNAPLKLVFAGVDVKDRYQPVLGQDILHDIDTPADAKAVGAELPLGKIEP